MQPRYDRVYTFRSDGTVELQCACGDTAHAFVEYTEFADIFMRKWACELCGCPDTRFQARTNVGQDGFTFREIVCLNPQCRARLDLSTTKEGSLFPKRKDKMKNWLPNGGWSRWTPQAQPAQQGTQPMSQPPPNYAPAHGGDPRDPHASNYGQQATTHPAEQTDEQRGSRLPF